MTPIQISWLAFCNTTGLTVDYILADENLINRDEHNLYSEKVVKPPNIWNAHLDLIRKEINELSALKTINLHGH